MREIVALLLDARPTLGPKVEDFDPPELTGDPQVDEVLLRMDNVDQEAFTARYTVVRPLGEREAEAVVEQAPPDRKITVGDVVMLQNGSDTTTCRGEPPQCESGIDESALAFLGIGSEFYARNPATEIRVSMARRSGQHTIS